MWLAKIKKGISQNMKVVENANRNKFCIFKSEILMFELKVATTDSWPT